MRTSDRPTDRESANEQKGTLRRSKCTFLRRAGESVPLVGNKFRPIGKGGGAEGPFAIVRHGTALSRSRVRDGLGPATDCYEFTYLPGLQIALIAFQGPLQTKLLYR